MPTTENHQTPDESLKKVRAKILGLKRRKRFVPYRASFQLAQELEQLLLELEAANPEPIAGFQLVTDFFETDKAIIGHCDDSSGKVGSVYSFKATELFVNYAKKLPDKQVVAETIVKLWDESAYGVRDELIDTFCQCGVPEKIMREIVSTQQDELKQVDQDRDRIHYRILIESLAKQLQDPKLYEESVLSATKEPHSGFILDIAKNYFESGDLEEAMRWIEKVPENCSRWGLDRDQLLLEIHSQSGDKKGQQELLFKKWHNHRSLDNFNELVAVIGEQKREEVLEAEVEKILNEQTFSLSDTRFLIDVGKTADAVNYLLDRIDQVTGQAFYDLTAINKVLESENHYLPVCLIYRKLIEATLAKAISKNYPHAVRYLKRLDQLESKVVDWRNFIDHQAYKQQLSETHKRKTSFWSRYEK